MSTQSFFNRIRIDKASDRSELQSDVLNYIEDNSQKLQGEAASAGLKAISIVFKPSDNDDNSIKAAFDFNQRSFEEAEKSSLLSKVDSFLNKISEGLGLKPTWVKDIGEVSLKQGQTIQNTSNTTWGDSEKGKPLGGNIIEGR